MRAFLLLLFLVLLIAVPLYTIRGSAHPLAALESVDACALMRGTPAFVAQVRSNASFASENIEGFAGSCRVTLPAAMPASIALRVLTTRKATALDGKPARPEAFYSVWLAETRASGATAIDIPGPWRAGAKIERAPGSPTAELLVEDDGVMVWIETAGSAREQLLPFANALVPGLRESQGL